MKPCSPITVLLASLALAAFATACGEDDNRRNPISKVDASVQDTAVVGDQDAQVNNNDGGNNQPDTNQNQEDTGGGGQDTGGGGQDTGGGGQDVGNEDAGPLPEACTVDTDCLAPNDTCARVDQTLRAIVRCNGGAMCECVNQCNFWQPDQGCEFGELCGLAGGMSDLPGLGICVDRTNGPDHRQACTAQYMGNTNTGDNCEIGTFCIGTSPQDVTGTCARLCSPANAGQSCQGLTDTCFDFDDPTTLIGLCLNLSTANDIGESCTAANQCQGNLCEPALANSCSADCLTDPLFVCPADAVCLFTAPNQAAAGCARICTFGTAGDTFCSGLNTNTICETLGTPPNTLDVCIPRCVADTDCPTTCNMTTGHCN